MTQIVPLQRHHFSGLKALLIGTFEARGDEDTLLHRWSEDPDMVPLVAVVDGDIRGFALASIRQSPDPRPYERDFGDRVYEVLGSGRIAVLHIMAVPSHYRHQGIGSALGNALATALIEAGIDACIGISWLHGGPDNSGPLFRRHGFIELGRNQGYYRQFHAQTGQRCPVCGDNACDCVAVAYGRCLRS